MLIRRGLGGRGRLSGKRLGVGLVPGSILPLLGLRSFDRSRRRKRSSMPFFTRFRVLWAVGNRSGRWLSRCWWVHPFLTRLRAIGRRWDRGRSGRTIRTSLRVLWAVGDRSRRRLSNRWWVDTSPQSFLARLRAVGRRGDR